MTTQKSGNLWSEIPAMFGGNGISRANLLYKNFRFRAGLPGPMPA
jgi:hypothetical protein